MEFPEQVLKEIEEILGVPNLKLEKDTNGQVKQITVKSVPSNSFKEYFNIIKNSINKNFNSYEEEIDSIKKSYIIQRVVDNFIYENILSKGSDLEDEDILSLKKFEKELIKLSVQTYENRLCTASFILLKGLEGIESAADFLRKMEIDFLPFCKNDENILDWESINEYPAAYRIIDSLSISYVLNNEYQIIGLARKTKSGKSIKDICVNKISKTMEYIYLENRKVMWCLTNNKMFVFNNGSWKLKDYSIIEGILDDFTSNNAGKEFRENRKKENTVAFLSEIIIDLSKSNTGALFIILAKNFYENKKNKLGHSKCKDSTILSKMTTGEKPGHSRYANIILKGRKNLALNRDSVDSYLIKLIADVDGAVIFNKDLIILDFARMIEEQTVDKDIIRQLIDVKENNLIPEDFEDKVHVKGGARSMATYEGSTFGLAIKVSEDGGITIFKRRKVILNL